MGNVISRGIDFEDRVDNRWRHDVLNDPVHVVECEDAMLTSPPLPAVASSLRGRELPPAKYCEGFFDFEGQEYFYRHLQLLEPRGVVFLVHGFCISSFELGHCAQQFRRMGLEVFCMDLTGHGRTAASTKLGLIRSWQESKASLVHFVRLMLHQRHVERLVDLPVFLYGISLGGALAFQLGHDLPEIFEDGGAILVSPCFRIPGLPAPWVQKILKGVSKLVPLMPVAKHRHDILTTDPVKSEWIQTKGKFYKIDGHVKARTAAQLVELSRDCCVKFRDFRIPFLTIHGTGDRITCHHASRELYYSSPQRFKRLKEFEGAFHVLQLEKDEVVDEYWTEISLFVRDRLTLVETERMTLQMELGMDVGVGAGEDEEREERVGKHRMQKDRKGKPGVVVVVEGEHEVLEKGRTGEKAEHREGRFELDVADGSMPSCDEGSWPPALSPKQQAVFVQKRAVESNLAIAASSSLASSSSSSSPSPVPAGTSRPVPISGPGRRRTPSEVFSCPSVSSPKSAQAMMNLMDM